MKTKFYFEPNVGILGNAPGAPTPREITIEEARAGLSMEVFPSTSSFRIIAPESPDHNFYLDVRQLKGYIMKLQ